MAGLIPRTKGMLLCKGLALTAWLVIVEPALVVSFCELQGSTPKG
ncbi:MAG: hypothetical protein ACRD5R_04445 [Candidatus Acidiferrales bacterium]